MKVFYVMICVAMLMGGFIFAEEEFIYNAKQKRDPFVPLVGEGGTYASDAYGVNSIEDIRLEGIVWEEGKASLAVVNGEIFREDEQIGVVKVLKIEKDAVIFDNEGERVKIELSTD